MNSEIGTKLHWDLGSAYDLFICLRILHNPEHYGLRASWAAGVRSRLSLEQRQTLETSVKMWYANPIAYVFSLPTPKNSETLLAALRALPPSRLLETLSLRYTTPEPLKEILLSTTSKRHWTEAEYGKIIEVFHSQQRDPQPTFLEEVYQTWANREKFGEDYLSALQAFVDNFFAEEEQRITPILHQGLSHAQMRAGSLPLPALLEEITHGVRYGDLGRISNLYLAPSFWGAPFLFYQSLDASSVLMLYGFRPDSMALIPGEVISETLLNGLSALSDSTRLRILRYLAQSPQTAAQLSRALRLRPPTVAHHLNQLRMAGLIQVILTPEGDRQYATRFNGLESIQDSLSRFIHGE